MKTRPFKFAVTWLCWAAVALSCPAQFSGPSPAGDWDCIVSGGGQQGIAFITFKGDGTFTGYQVLTSKVNSEVDYDGRNPGGGEGRYPTVPVDRGDTNLFGFGDLSGPWGFDASGKVIGSFTEVLADGGESGAITNSVSFQAKVVSGKRLTMTCSTVNGKIVYKGIPLAALPALTGGWYGTKVQNGQSFVEFFDLSSSGYQPNLYTLEGEGPAYTTQGVCMRSAQNKIAIAIMEGVGTNMTVRATCGSFGKTSKSSKASTKGAIEPATPIQFNVVLTPGAE
jgi:hypothetical protein